MRTADEIQQELTLSESYYQSIAINKRCAKSMWYAGYIVGLKFALGLNSSRAVTDFNDLFPKETLDYIQKILNEQEATND